MKVFVTIVMLCILLPCSFLTYDGIDELKEAAPEVFSKAGFEVIGYEGYTLGSRVPFTDYGSANVWFILKREDTIYSALLNSWGDEIHIYNLKALNAIRGD